MMETDKERTQYLRELLAQVDLKELKTWWQRFITEVISDALVLEPDIEVGYDGDP